MAADDPTFKDLQDRCLDFGYGEVDRTRFKTWINMAQEDIMGRRRWSWSLTSQTISTVAGTQTATVTTAPQYWGRLEPVASTTSEPRYMDIMSLGDDWPRHGIDSTTRGMPTAYTYAEGALTFYPIPDAVYQYKLHYWKDADEMSGDTDKSLIPARWRDVLVWGALCHAAVRDRDANALAYRTDMFERRIRRLATADNFPQQETRRKARMPSSYYGSYDGAGGIWRP